MKTVLLVLCFLVLASCTTVKYNTLTHDVNYWSVLQKKSLTVSVTPDPITGKENIQVVFMTNSDPAVQMFQSALSAAQQAAIMYGLPALSAKPRWSLDDVPPIEEPKNK
jgi:hypothetical protein